MCPLDGLCDPVEPMPNVTYLHVISRIAHFSEIVEMQKIYTITILIDFFIEYIY